MLEIDVGNTRLKWRLRSVTGCGQSSALLRSDYATHGDLLQALGECLQASSPARVMVATVADEILAGQLARWSFASFGVVAEFAWVTTTRAGVEVAYDEPGRLGVDRWLAVLAASRQQLDGVIVVDCGSAVTIDILEGKRHLGGYIAPGLRLMRDALYKDTAQVRVADLVPTNGSPGRSTNEAVSAGLALMLAGMVQQAIAHVRHKGWWRPGFSGRVLLTGGDAPLVHSLLASDTGLAAENIRFVEDLVLDGLALVATRQWSGD